MNRAQDITPASPEEARLRDFDLREIDAPDQGSHWALKYVGRLEAVLRAIRRHAAPGSWVLEVGCAQANASLLLAEQGFRAVALDVLPDALRYARRKYSHGSFYAVCGRAEALPVRARSCDVIYLGEILEHCARPADLLRDVSRCLRPGGVMIITTMNGSWFGSPDPTYTQVAGGVAAKPQYGRAGEDHLFAFTWPELRDVVREAGLRILGMERHASVLHSDRLRPFRRVLPPRWVRALSRLVCRLPVVGRLTALTLLVIAQAPQAQGGRNQV